MKTFQDLKFENWMREGREQVPLDFFDHYGKDINKQKQAVMKFRNGYGVSVICGDMFYSNGIDTYEVAVLVFHTDGSYDIIYPENICPDHDVLGYITAEKVTDVMLQVQALKKRS